MERWVRGSSWKMSSTARLLGPSQPRGRTGSPEPETRFALRVVQSGEDILEVGRRADGSTAPRRHSSARPARSLGLAAPT